MVYSLMIFAPRKPGVSHEEFKARYERHMKMIAEISGDAMPLRHTRYYLQHGGPEDKPRLLAGNTDEMFYDAIVHMSFEDDVAFHRFYDALMTDEANATIEADEAGFWDRGRMKVVVVGDIKESRK